MRTVPVTIDTHLRVDGQLLPAAAVEEILDELIITNGEKIEAMELGRPGVDKMPDKFFCVEMDGDELIMSRGWALQLKLLLREHGIRVRWRDKRKWRKGPAMGKEEFSYREHQPAAVDAMKKHQFGIYKAPTGSGKTVSAVGFIWEKSPMMSLILVDRINLVDQWIDRISEHLGIPKEEIGRIGEGGWTEGRITVATVQTLYKNRGRLEDEGWFDLWDCVFLDECHHVTAETFMDLIQRFHARYRIGMSATPDKTGIFDLALNTLGEVFYETTQEELRELGILREPTIEVVPTAFSFPYHGNHKADKNGSCDKHGCRDRTPYHRHINNYTQLKQALVEDPGRTALIVDKLEEHIDHVQLVITDQTKQIDAIKAEIERRELDTPVYVLVGKLTGKKKQEIIGEIEDRAEPCILLSTIAGEALDIPIIDTVHLVFPTRNPRKTEQNVGRGVRAAENKADPLILDYVDWLVSILTGQFRTRRWECYEPLGFTVNVPENVSQGQRKRGLTSLGRAR